jgi:predicted transcriptional regulator
MKKQSGMRPHDIVILLKIIAKGDKQWLMKDLAQELEISSSEVSESLNRSVYSGLLKSNKKEVLKMALLEFLQYGLKYIYPQQPGALVRGMPTAYSASPLNKTIVSEEAVVWPYVDGTVRGQAITPLYEKAPIAALRDPVFYELLALVDALRVGRVREKNIALVELKNRIE